ncbi:sugar phosphate isomerase/epimerase family protein [Streptomyces sp. NPDC058665]|uniref:sugar phosphate isomerase/epimerase family protein n=1 Tax=Streptomyces sp. NPDC058665 TaxID=3346586 RepID=UPI00364BDE2D
MSVNGTRRAFLGTAAGLAAVGLASTGTTAYASESGRGHGHGHGHGRPKRKIPRSGIGMHLYTMRSILETDFEGTLEQLADIGYATVGVSGRFGRNATQIRQVLDDVGLKAVLEHVGYGIVAGTGLQQAIADVHTLGGEWVVVPSLPGEMHTPAGYREAAAAMNRAGRVARESGLGPVLFHNHDADHKVVDGEVLYDILLNETDPEYVGFELDLYWAAKGGADPRRLFVEEGPRFPALHVKDMAPNGDFADVGSGVLDFAEMFETARRGGVRQWLVEHDSPKDPIATARNSYRHLSRLRY